jgi:hypothetical protein
MNVAERLAGFECHRCWYGLRRIQSYVLVHRRVVVGHNFIHTISVFGEKAGREVKLPIPLTLIDLVGKWAKLASNVGG